ncbi:FAD-binding oxidoreductase [Trujillonella endophytica]|uniref:FAD/FMN-containing dehydrogenase n=1 Tax=Trujillonella endophytica TaxID=673521 RepID=A0A1H8WKW3_9ACTN|nr:FAD-binding oxidoreductase [Trujillella endophytica]SEP28291.1 FAD/FMN-containing dehydrogenase [Trujillella endophytica]
MSITQDPRTPLADHALEQAAHEAPAAPAAAVPAADVDELRTQVHGPVYAAGDDGLAAEVAAWNVAVQHTPAVAVGATCATDVAAAVRFAVAHGLPVAVQATGHGPVRNAAGAVMITTRRMQGVVVDPVRRTARVQAGVRWAAVLEAAAEHGLTGLCGSSSDVGVVGYTLGGGMGSLGRRFGFAADHVHAVEMVTADGVLRRVDASSDPELFWAVRGGKGSLGVVTAIEIDLVPVRSVLGGGIFFAAEDAAAVLHAYRRWAPTLPEEVATSVAVLRLPPLEELPPPLQGQTVVHLRYAYSGDDLAEGERLVAPMKEAGRIVLGAIVPLLATELDAIHMDPRDPMPAWEKGMLLAELTEETVDAFLAAVAPEAPLPLIMAEIRQLGGALSRPAAVPNAVAGRSGAWSVLVIGPMVPELADVVPQVGRGVLGALAPWAAPGCMLNFLGDVSGPDEVLAAYVPADAARLLAVKRAVDPTGVFTTGHAIG